VVACGWVVAIIVDVLAFSWFALCFVWCLLFQVGSSAILISLIPVAYAAFWCLQTAWLFCIQK